jgi:hypothetical protein
VLDWWQALLLSLPALVATLIAAFYAPAFAERAVQRRRERRDFRQAQRLVADELHRLGGDLRFTSRQPVAFPPEAIGFLLTDEWSAHKTTLARLVDPGTWSQLASAYMAIIRIRYAVASGPGQAFEGDVSTLLTDLADSCDLARQSLVDAAPQIA